MTLETCVAWSHQKGYYRVKDPGDGWSLKKGNNKNENSEKRNDENPKGRKIKDAHFEIK